MMISSWSGNIARTPTGLDTAAHEQVERAVAAAVKAEQERSAQLLQFRLAEARADAIAAKEAAAAAEAAKEVAKASALEAGSKAAALASQVGNLRKEVSQLTHENEALRSQVSEAKTVPLGIAGLPAPRATTPAAPRAPPMPLTTAHLRVLAPSDKKGGPVDLVPHAVVAPPAAPSQDADAASVAAIAAAYGVDARLVASVKATLHGFEGSVPAGSYNEEHAARIISAATAAVLASEGNVAMPPAPPSLAPISSTVLAAAEAAYELQCAVGPARAGSRVPDFYRAWMEEQLDHHGLSGAERPVRVNNSLAPFSPPSASCTHGLNSSAEVRAAGKAYAAAFPQVHSPHARRLVSAGQGGGDARPWTPTALASPTGADARGSARGEQLTPMVIGMLQHDDAAVRDAAQSVLENLRKLPLPPGALSTVGLPMSPVAVPRPRQRPPEATPPKAGGASAQPPSSPAKAEGGDPKPKSRLGGPPTNQAISVRIALGPEPTATVAAMRAAVDGLHALKTALSMLGPECMPLHGMSMLLGKLVEHPEGPIRSAAHGLLETLRRVHGDDPLFSALASAHVGAQTLAARRRAPLPPPLPPLARTPEALAAATRGLGAAVSVFGDRLLHLPVLLEHAEPRVREAAASLADAAAKAASAAAASGTGGARDGVFFEVKGSGSGTGTGIGTGGSCIGGSYTDDAFGDRLSGSPLTRDRKTNQLRRDRGSPAGWPLRDAKPPDGLVAVGTSPGAALEATHEMLATTAEAERLAAEAALASLVVAASDEKARYAASESPTKNVRSAVLSTALGGSASSVSLELSVSARQLHAHTGGAAPRSSATAPPRQPTSPPADLSWKAQPDGARDGVGGPELKDGHGVALEYVSMIARSDLHEMSERHVAARSPSLGQRTLSPARGGVGAADTQLSPGRAHQYAGGAGASVPSMMQLARPLTSDTALLSARKAALRASASVGALPSSVDPGALGAAMGDNPYLQKLPPVLRRSVCGNGARQHTRAVYQGER
jgi:hypothetical protein